MAQDKPLVEGKYLMFKGKPFVCENNTYCYGDMTDNFVSADTGLPDFQNHKDDS